MKTPIYQKEFIMTRGSMQGAGLPHVNVSQHGSDSIVFDHVKKNLFIREKKTLASQAMEKSRSQIQAIYKALEVQSTTLGDLNKISKIQNLMSPVIRNKFLKNQMHYELTEEINLLNQASIEIFEQVSCYKMELGLTLKQLLETFTILFIQQYEIFNMTENQKEQEFIRKV